MIRPPYLKRNDCVAIISPAGKIAPHFLDNAVMLLKQWGLSIKIGPHATNQFMGFAGTDDERRNDLQAAIDDPEIAAIICARGGYGCGRIVDSVNFSPLVKSPKWLVGFSDITVLHAHLQRMGIQSIHGAMPKNFSPNAAENESTSTLHQALFGLLNSYTIPAHPFNTTGHAHGILVGGNLSLIANLAATPDDIISDGAILFIEDVSEFYYHIDRMMNNLQRSAKLNCLAGVIVGHFSETKNDEIIVGKTDCEVIDEYLKPLNIPICYGFPAGHEEPNYALYFGRPISLKVNDFCVITFNPQ